MPKRVSVSIITTVYICLYKWIWWFAWWS